MLPLPQGAGRLKRECRSHTLKDRLVVGCFSCHLYLLVFSFETKAPVGTSCEPKAYNGYKFGANVQAQAETQKAHKSDAIIWKVGCSPGPQSNIDWIVYRKVIFWPKTAGLLVLGHLIVPEIAC